MVTSPGVPFQTSYEAYSPRNPAGWTCGRCEAMKHWTSRIRPSPRPSPTSPRRSAESRRTSSPPRRSASTVAPSAPPGPLEGWSRSSPSPPSDSASKRAGMPTEPNTAPSRPQLSEIEPTISLRKPWRPLKARRVPGRMRRHLSSGRSRARQTR